MPNLSPQQATRQAMSAQWALNQLGSRNYFNLCQRFIEQAYGTGGQYASAAAASNSLMNNTNPDDADVGDLVFFRPDASNGGAGHVGIYLGNGEMVSATNGGITRDNLLTNSYWKNLLVGFGDPPDQWKGASDQSLVQGASDLLQRGATAVGDMGRAAAAKTMVAWGGAGKWISQIADASQKYDVPINLVAATMNAESGGNPAARSPVGAMGLMQLMPTTAQGLGATDPSDPAQNIDAGVKYMRQLYDRFGDWGKVTQAYNAGPNGNWNNPETKAHLTKVMKMASDIGGSIGASGGGGGMPGSGFGGPGGPGGGGPGRDEPPEIKRLREQATNSGMSALEKLWSEFQQKFGGSQPAQQPGVQTSAPTGGGSLADIIARGQAGQAGRVQTAPPPGGGSLADILGSGGAGLPNLPGAPGLPGSPGGPGGGPNRPGGGSDLTSGVSQQGALTEPNVSSSPPGTGGTPAAAKARPGGWTDPASVPEAYRGIIGASNDLLDQMAKAQEALNSAAPGSDAAYTAQKAYDSALQRWGQIAPTVGSIVQAAQKSRAGEFVPGTNASQPAWTIVKQDPVTGAITTETIQNPNVIESDAKISANASMANAQTAAGASRYGSDLGLQASQGNNAASRYAADQGLAGTNVSAQASRDVAGINARTSLATTGMTTDTSRVTAALSAAVQQQQNRLDAQIRAGDLSLREATEKFNEWYKQNVEAPLSILQQKRETERYKIEAQNAVTARATGQSEHERGVANIGQQMWGSAATAYNQMIPLTTGAGWGEGFQQNLTGQGYTPHQGASFNTPESLDAFATRKTAEMLAGVSPYAQNILSAQGAMGNPGQAMGGDQMTGLMNAATGVAQNALNNPYTMPQQQPIQMGAPLDIGAIASANSPGLTPQMINQYLPDYSSQSGSGVGLG